MSKHAGRYAAAMVVAVLMAPADGADASDGGWVAVKKAKPAVPPKRELVAPRAPLRGRARRPVAQQAQSSRVTLLPESGWQSRSGASADRPAALMPSGAVVPRSGAALRSPEALLRPKGPIRPNIAPPHIDPWSTANARRAFRRGEQAAGRSGARARRGGRATSSGFDYYFDVRGFDRARRVPISRPLRYRYRPNGAFHSSGLP